MTYKLILAVLVVISVSIATALGKNGPKWKSPLIAGVIFFAGILLLDFFGLSAEG